MKTKTLILAAALAATSSPAFARTIAVQQSEGVAITYADNVASGESDLPGSFVAISPAEEPKGQRFSVSLYLHNHSGAPLNFGATNVTATAGETKLAAISEAQLLKEQKGREFWAGMALAVAAGLNEGSAGYGSMHTSGYVGRTHYSSTTTYQDPVARAMARRENNEMYSQFSAAAAARRGEIMSKTLSINTVNDGSEGGGVITFELPKALAATKGPVPVTIAIDVGGTLHRFQVMANKK